MFARRHDRFLIQSIDNRSDNTTNLQYLVRSVGFITRTHLKSLQWNDAADVKRTMYVQKLSDISLTT